MKTKRLYRIKHKTNGLYYNGRTEYIGKRKNSISKKPFLLFENYPENTEIEGINCRIADIVRRGMQSQLASCEVEAIEIVHKVVKTSVKLENIRIRKEQERIMSILKVK